MSVSETLNVYMYIYKFFLGGDEKGKGGGKEMRKGGGEWTINVIQKEDLKILKGRCKFINFVFLMGGVLG